MNLRHLARVPRPLATLVQPIVDTSSGTARLFAVECLTRGPRGSRLEEALPLFEYIRRRGLEQEMDRTCISQALHSAATCQCRITVNVHPGSLTDGFVPFILEQSRRAGIDPCRLIVEVGEQSPCSESPAFRRALHALRQHGIGIAVDDVGYGHSNLRAILECRPDYLKIDRYFVDGIDGDGARVAAIESIQRVAAFFGAKIIAEGVERQRDLDVLRLLGIHLFQGFLFSRPAAVSRDWPEHPLVNWVLQDDGTGEQPLVKARIDVASDRDRPVDGGHYQDQRAVERLGLGTLKGVEREAPADHVCVE